jgi:hypothetical protein
MDQFGRAGDIPAELPDRPFEVSGGGSFLHWDVLLKYLIEYSGIFEDHRNIPRLERY